jgi:hypothetical protein
MYATPLTLKLQNSRLLMDTPIFVAFAGECLTMDQIPGAKLPGIDNDNVGFLATRLELDTKVL